MFSNETEITFQVARENFFQETLAKKIGKVHRLGNDKKQVVFNYTDKKF